MRIIYELAFFGKLCLVRAKQHANDPLLCPISQPQSNKLQGFGIQRLLPGIRGNASAVALQLVTHLGHDIEKQPVLRFEELLYSLPKATG